MNKGSVRKDGAFFVCVDFDHLFFTASYSFAPQYSVGCFRGKRIFIHYNSDFRES